jgi:hypothetical protein
MLLQGLIQGPEIHLSAHLNVLLRVHPLRPQLDQTVNKATLQDSHQQQMADLHLLHKPHRLLDQDPIHNKPVQFPRAVEVVLQLLPEAQPLIIHPHQADLNHQEADLEMEMETILQLLPQPNVQLLLYAQKTHLQ